MREKFRINISPVSGRYFTNQIALKCNFNDAMGKMHTELYGGYRSIEDYKPNIAFASSGGNVSEYMDMAADYSSERLLNIVKQLESEIFVKSWIPKGLEFVPGWLVGITKNSLYRKGYGPHYIFRANFNSDTVKKTEIITGTYNIETCRTQCFSNFSSTNSHFNHNLYNLDKHIYDCMPIKFLDGNLTDIADACFASASVPLVTETHKVQDKYYSDGGVTYDSPIASFKFEIIRIIEGKTQSSQSNILTDLNKVKSYVLSNNDIYDCVNYSNPKALRMTYFACYQIDTHYDSCGKNVKEQFTEVFRQQRHILAIHDKNAALEILYHVVGDQTKIRNENIYNMTVDELTEKLKFLETKLHYLIILYPHGYVYIKENYFTGDDLLRYINITRENFGVDIYYSEDAYI